MTSLNPVMSIGAQVEKAIRAHEPKTTSAEARRAARFAAVDDVS